MEPDAKDFAVGTDNFIEPHSMHPLNVLRMANSMNGPLKRVLLVGCEPATLGGEEGQMGLSVEVERAVEEAVQTTEALIRQILGEKKFERN